MLLRPGDSRSIVPRATRFVAAIPVVYRVVGKLAWQRGVTVNISNSGVLLGAAAPVPLESLLEMMLQFPERLGRFPAGQLNCVAQVVRRAPPTPAVPHAVAASFVERSLSVG